MSRKKYDDRHSAGRSTLCPFVPGEASDQRHARRLETNLSFENEVREWCDFHGVKLEIKNQGHHWRFSVVGKGVDWWPSSAKLVVDQQWSKGHHVHDYRQALARVSKHLCGVPLKL